MKRDTTKLNKGKIKGKAKNALSLVLSENAAGIEGLECKLKKSNKNLFNFNNFMV